VICAVIYLIMLLIFTMANQMKTQKVQEIKIKTVLCAVVGTAGHQRRLEMCTICDRFVCVLKNGRAIPNLFALN